MTRINAIVALGVLALAASLPLWLAHSAFLLNVALVTLIFTAAAIAWNIVAYGGQISFGHSVFFGLGAYATVLLKVDFNLTPWLGIFVSGLLAAIVAVGIGMLSLRQRGIYFALVTFALTLIFSILAVHFEGLTGGDVGLSVPLLGNAPTQFQFTSKIWYYYIALAFVAAFFAIAAWVYSSRLGLSLRAIRDDENAARACGVKTVQLKIVTLALSGLLTGIIGGVYVQSTLFIDPNTAFGANTAIQIALIAIAGGMGRLCGPLVGGIILVPLQQVLGASLWGWPAGLNLALYAIVVLTILLLDPRGMVDLAEGIAATARRLVLRGAKT